MANEFPDALANISDEELAFRGWTREGLRQRWAARVEADRYAPRPGDPAPDFELERLSPAGKRASGNLRLSSLRGKPVGLIFGSYT